MSNETQPSFSRKEDDEQDAELENLIKRYIKKSEELEKRESKVLQQVELLQSAVASLQAWKDSRKPSVTSSQSAPTDFKEIEESRKIKEETMRIQEEVKQKIAENKILEEEIERRRTLESEKEVEDVFQKIMEARGRIERVGKEEIESRSSRRIPDSELDLEPPELKKKIQKLEEMEKKLKKELMIGSEEFNKKRKSLSDKIALLERESLIHRQFIENLKNQNYSKTDIFSDC